MNNELDQLIAAARRATMTAQEKEEQRRSFAYGNTNIENDHVTREVIDEAALELDAARGERR
jgi:hypothetical protein